MFELEDIPIFGISSWLDVFEEIRIEYIGCEWIFCLGVVFLSAILLRGYLKVRRRTLFNIAVIVFKSLLVEFTAILFILLHH